MLGVVACVRSPSAVMARWNIGCTVQLTKEPCEEGESPYSDLSFATHMAVVVHTRACVCMYLPSLLTFTSHIHPRGKNEQDSKQEDFIFFSFSSRL